MNLRIFWEIHPRDFVLGFHWRTYYHEIQPGGEWVRTLVVTLFLLPFVSVNMVGDIDRGVVTDESN